MNENVKKMGIENFIIVTLLLLVRVIEESTERMVFSHN